MTYFPPKVPTVVLGTAASVGTAKAPIASDSTLLAFDVTAPSTQAFGDAAAAGSATVAPRRDHKHAMPANPVTGHEAAADPHTGYILESSINAKGDLIVGSADNTPAIFTAGANDTILMYDSTQASGVKAVASQTPSTQAYGDSAAEGTADTYSRGDHKHGMPAAGGDPTPFMITPWTRNSIGTELAAFGAVLPGSNAWPAANRAIWVPFYVMETVTVVKMFWLNGAIVGNGTADIGIYNSAFALQVSMGPATTAGANVIQEADITNTALTAGQYYMALALSNATDHIQSTATATVQFLKSVGMAQEASASTLPSTGTPVVISSSYVPYFGLSLRTLVS